MSHKQVKEFMQAFGQVTPDHECALDNATRELRISLIEEEYHELLEAEDLVGIADALTDLKYVIHGCAIAMGVELEDDTNVPDGIYDSYELEAELGGLITDFRNSIIENEHNLVVTYLTYMLNTINKIAYSCDIPIVECMDEVHASNMSKLGEDGRPIYREDGKVLKGPNYFQPNLTKILIPGLY